MPFSMPWAKKKTGGNAGPAIRPFAILCMAFCGAAAFAGAEDLQARIDACSASGGGVVRVEQGLHADMNPIVLRSNVELRLDAGAVLRATTNYNAYAHMPGWDRGALISAVGATNVAITGEGRIECSGDRAPFVDRAPGRWRGIHLYRCRGVRLERFHLANSHSWGCYLQECDGVAVKGLSIVNHSNHNNDGLDIASRNVTVEDCDIDSEDDALVFKNHNPDFVVENVVVRNCRLASNSSFVKLGTETWGGFRNIRVSDCELDCRTFVSRRAGHWGTPGVSSMNTGLDGLSVMVVDGGFAEDVVYSRIRMKRGVMSPIFIRLDKRNARADGRPTYLRNVTIEDVEMERPATSYIASSITGASGLRPSDITLRRVRVRPLACKDAEIANVPVPEGEGAYPYGRMFKCALPAHGFYLRHADRVTFEDVSIDPTEADVRKPIVADDASYVSVATHAPDGTTCPRPRALDCGVGANVLDGEGLASWSAAYNELFDLDAAADDAWRAVGTAQAFDARRAELRAKMIERIGGFPASRTPLNARKTGSFARAGYVVEKIVFESRPGAYVTGLLFLPASDRFAPPYPAAVQVCGHSAIGKAAPKYQRVAMLASRCGVSTFVIDPIGQGERHQCAEDENPNTTIAHLRLGVNAMLLGHGLAAFEMWDAIRALDYLDARSDLRHDGYGSFGNSGGGMQSVMLSALDDRIKATATSCYLSNLREQTAWRLLADSEQIIFAQLKDGLNHAAYPLLGGNPVLMLARRDEMIPFTGTRETFRVLTKVAENLGRSGWYSMCDVPGLHGYCERTMRASVTFLAMKLRGEKADFGDIAAGDMGATPEDCRVTETGQVMDFPGFRSAYDYLRDEFDAALGARREMSGDERSALVRRLADIDENRLGAREVLGEETFGDVRLVRAAYEAKGGYHVPVVELVPSDAKGAPLLLVGDGSRSNRMEMARGFLKADRPVMLADVVATGEIGGTRHCFANPNNDEEVAKMLYLVGSSLVGRRAGEIIALARDLKARYGQAPSVVAQGRTAVAAAHAHAAAADAVESVKAVDAPLAWAEAVRTHAFYDYAAAVHGGLLHYDWIDLLE